MQDVQAPLEVLNGRHHLGQRLHLGEDVDEGLRVVEARQDLLRQCLLDVVDGLLLGLCRCELWVLLDLHLLEGPLQSVDQSLVLCLDLHLLRHSKGRESFSGSFGLGRGGDPGLHGRLHLGLRLRLGLRLGAHLGGELDQGSRYGRLRVHLHERAIV